MSELSKILTAPPLPRATVAAVVPADAASVAPSGNILPLTAVSGPTSTENQERAREDSSEMRERVSAAVSHMNEYVKAAQRDLSFMYDADRGETVVQVIDRNTQEVIRQIPDAIFLKIADQLANESPGALLSARV